MLLYTIYSNDFLYVLPELYFLFSFFYLVLVFIYFNTFLKGLKYKNNFVYLSLYFSIITLILFLNSFSKNYFCFNWFYFSNSYIFVFKLLVVVFFIFCLFMFLDVLSYERFNYLEYLLFSCISIFASFMIISSNDFMFLYVGIELLGLSSYVLASLKKYSSFSSEAGLKYFVLSSFSSVFILKGISLIYGIFGSTNYREIFDLSFNLKLVASSELIYVLPIALIFIGVFFKVAVAPFHFWSPDVYEGSPTSVTLFFSIVPKITFLAILFRLIFEVFYNYFEYLSHILTILGLLSVLLGSISALYQFNFKRLIAYSSISHSGFLLLCFVSGTYFGIFAFFIYLFVYLVLNLNFFLFFIHVRFSNFFLELSNTSFLYYLFRVNSILGLLFSLLMFSFAGVPPLAGFFGKFFLFYSLLEMKGYYIFVLLVFLTVISVVYYIRLVIFIFFKDSIVRLSLLSLNIKEKNWYMLVILGYFNLFFVFFQDWVFFYVHNFIIASCLFI